MIRKLSGTIVDTTLHSVVLEVAGVGYLIHTSATGSAYALGDIASFWTYLAVRETALDLYGFLGRDELEMFELLLGLPKIGPKSAGQILANADLTLLRQAISQQDPVYLSKLSGIGKKTAETVVYGLKDKLPAGHYLGMGDNPLPPAPWQHETIDALISLGYPNKDARDAVLALPPEVASTKEALTAALKTLSS